MAESKMAPPQTPENIGGYRVLNLLNWGGMAAVYRATKSSVATPVAIKWLMEGIDPRHGAALFHKEVTLLEALRGTSRVVQYLETGEHNGRRYTVLELVEGPTLHDLLASGPLTPERAFPIALDICRALIEVHAKNVVHRDLKPENIMLVPVANGYSVKLIDFNVGEWLSNLHETRVVVGTPYYIAPEQARGETHDEKCDIFSWGCVLFQMLTGTYLGGNIEASKAAVARQSMTHAPLGKWRSKIPPALLPILEAALSAHPDARPTATELLTQLEAVQSEFTPRSFFQLPRLETKRPVPVAVARNAHTEIIERAPEPHSWVTGAFALLMSMLALFVGSLTAYSWIIDRSKPRVLYSDLDIRVRTTPDPPRPTTPSPPAPTTTEPTTPSPPPTPPQPVRVVVRNPAPEQIVEPRRNLPAPITGARPLPNGNYRIPHPDDWRDIPDDRRHAMCRAFRLRGIYGTVFHQFCDGW